jgi:hypothetical protein
MGKSIIETGMLGSGHAMKALNNYVSAAGLLAQTPQPSEAQIVHALEGNLHFVFTQDFGDAAEVERYARFMDDVCRLVVEQYDGSLKAEHGTGRNMAPFVEMEWGRQATDLMRRIKRLFDPDKLLNPGVIINDDPHAHLKNLKTMSAAEDIVDRWHSPAPKVLLECFRGGAKSTLSEEAVALLACYREFANCIILGESEGRAVDRLRAGSINPAAELAIVRDRIVLNSCSRLRSSSTASTCDDAAPASLMFRPSRPRRAACRCSRPRRTRMPPPLV